MNRSKQPDQFCDLHAHSSASDGTDAPEALGALAWAAGLGAVALTDHDTVAGLAKARSGAEAAGVAFVPGIELSADPDVLQTGESRGTLHLLGYFVDDQASQLVTLCEELRASRNQRNPEILARLRTLGVQIDEEEVASLAAGAAGEPGVVGRPHIAQAMVQRGYVKSIHEAFQTYLGKGGAAFVRRDRVTAQQAMDAVHSAGGLVVLAHPVQLKLDDRTCEQVVSRLKADGLDGIETVHPDHDAADRVRFETYARKFALLATGGSDYHGQRKAIELGSQRVDFQVYERLADAAGVTA
ncbi:MAG: PHP domain-containing protein [Planctomycetota bacterium]